jgi:hypothetical protein
MEVTMKLKLLHYIARMLGIQFKVGGIPYGAPSPISGGVVEPIGAAVVPR